jgi:hypothetical protein
MPAPKPFIVSKKQSAQACPNERPVWAVNEKNLENQKRRLRFRHWRTTFLDFSPSFCIKQSHNPEFFLLDSEFYLHLPCSYYIIA